MVVGYETSDGNGQMYGELYPTQKLYGEFFVAGYEPSDRGRLKRFAEAPYLMSLWNFVAGHVAERQRTAR